MVGDVVGAGVDLVDVELGAEVGAKLDVELVLEVGAVDATDWVRDTSDTLEVDSDARVNDGKVGVGVVTTVCVGRAVIAASTDCVVMLV